MRKFFPLIIILIVLAADILSKYIVNAHFPVMRGYAFMYPYGGIGVFKDFFGIEFSIVHHINRGAAWGHFADYQIQLVWLRIGLILGLAFYLLFLNHHKQWVIPLSLIIAGAIGNVIDFFVYGHVIDMLHFNFWGYDYPVFNIADSAIFIGVASLLIMSFFSKTSQQSKAE